MNARQQWKRELRVAFSLKAQPLWFRILKWVVAIGVSVALWKTSFFWIWILCGAGLGLSLHCFYRWKTHAWTQPWGGWDDVESADKED